MPHYLSSVTHGKACKAPKWFCFKCATGLPSSQWVMGLLEKP